MKIFLDTADTQLIEKHFTTGLIDCITTNPSLILKSGKQPEDVYLQLAELGIPDISMEVVGSDKEMFNEGMRLYDKFGDQCTVKVPCTPDGLVVCKDLAEEGIDVNVTLIFSVSQAVLATKAGARYLSPFVGRVDDQRFGGCNLIKRIREVLSPTWKDFNPYEETEILSASIRSVGDVEHSFAQGADIVTMPPGIFAKMYDHVLTDVGIEIFDKDYANAIATK